MTTAYVAILVSVAVSTALAPGLSIAEATGEPWWIVAIVVPLAGFTAWLVKWILDKQDERDKAVAEREKLREAREEKRAEQLALQTVAMQQVVVELAHLQQQHEDHAKALAQIPINLVASVTALIEQQRKQS